MLEIVDTDLEPEPHLAIGLAVRRDLLAAGVRLVDDGAPLLGRHAFGEEHLDDVGARIQELPSLGARVRSISNRKELTGRCRLAGAIFASAGPAA